MLSPVGIPTARGLYLWFALFHDFMTLGLQARFSICFSHETVRSTQLRGWTTCGKTLNLCVPRLSVGLVQAPTSQDSLGYFTKALDTPNMAYATQCCMPNVLCLQKLPLFLSTC